MNPICFIKTRTTFKDYHYLNSTTINLPFTLEILTLASKASSFEQANIYQNCDLNLICDQSKKQAIINLKRVKTHRVDSNHRHITIDLLIFINLSYTSLEKLLTSFQALIMNQKNLFHDLNESLYDDQQIEDLEKDIVALGKLEKKILTHLESNHSQTIFDFHNLKPIHVNTLKPSIFFHSFFKLNTLQKEETISLAYLQKIKECLVICVCHQDQIDLDLFKDQQSTSTIYFYGVSI